VQPLVWTAEVALLQQRLAAHTGQALRPCAPLADTGEGGLGIAALASFDQHDSPDAQQPHDLPLDEGMSLERRACLAQLQAVQRPTVCLDEALSVSSQ
jgi:hypothetical protein